MSVNSQMEGFQPAPAEVAVWSLGQSGFLLKGCGGTALIDPYLSNSIEEQSAGPAGRWARLFAPPVAADALKGVDLLLASHVHDDHCDRATVEPLLKANPGAIVCGPYPVRDALESWGIAGKQVIAPPFGRLEPVGGIGLAAVPSTHYAFDPDEQGEPAYAGYVVEIDGVRIYHAGDTSLYEGMAERIGSGIDLALLPVNGRDAVRERIGIVGNMDAKEAFWLAEAIGNPVVIPMHNDLFAVNQSPWSSVWETRESYFPHLRCHRLLPGEMMIVRGSCTASK